MAKKKNTKKATAKVAKRSAKAAPKRTLKAAKTTRAAKPARRAGPRSQALPGMEEVRYKDLDKVCEQIAETREEINRFKGEEADLERQALGSMRRHERQTYTWSGVTLVRIPGEERLMVRNARQRQATAEEAKETAIDESLERQQAQHDLEDAADADLDSDTVN